MEKVYSWLRTGLDWLLPLHCRLCGEQVAWELELCPGCYRDLPWLKTACRRCADPLPAEPQTLLCGRCLRRPPPFDRVIAPLHFAPPVDGLIHAYKFHGDLAAGRLLANLLAAATTASRPELLLPVPLHARRLRQRGFNQSLELARQLSRQRRLPLADRLLVRCRDTPPQRLLPASERRANVRGAFALRGPLSARHVAVLDDVMTTGQTMMEICRLLRRAGAARIEVWVVARA